MKKIVSIIVLLATLAMLLVSCKESDAPDGMIKASSDAAPYVFYIPEDWKVDLQTGVTTAHDSENVRTTVSVTAYELENREDTIETWWEVNLHDLEAAFDEYTEISSGNTEIDGVHAVEYVYSAKIGTDSYTFRQVAAINGGNVYLITYSATSNVFEAGAEDFTKMVDNFLF